MTDDPQSAETRRAAITAEIQAETGIAGGRGVLLGQGERYRR